MAIILKQSTGIDVRVGPFVDATDGVTPETGITLGAADQAELLKANGAATVDISAATWAAVTGCDGWYDLTLTTSHTDTVGEMVIVVQDSSVCLPVFVTCQVVEEAVYDDFFAASADNGVAALATVDSNVDAILVDTGTTIPGVLGTPAGADLATDIAAVDTVVDSILADTGTDGVVVAAASKTGYRLSATGVDDIWDEATSGHVTAGSFGARLAIARSATAQAGASTTITLDASASATNDFYNNNIIYVVSGTGSIQGNRITDYDGTTKVATVQDTWAVNPDATSVFLIIPEGSIPGASAPTASAVADAVWDEAYADHTSEGSYGSVFQPAHEGTAQAGTSSSITLDATGSSSTNDFYNYSVVTIIAGTGAGQARQITDYNGTTKVATVDPAWTTAPSTDSQYLVVDLGIDAATTAQIADAVWDEARSGHVTAGTFGEYTLSDAVRVSGSTSAADGLEAAVSGATPLPANVTQISDDATAATNLESYTDGTTPMPVNATQISGDATAADNLEAALDGTGGVTISANIDGYAEIRTSGGSAGDNTADLVSAILTTQMTEAYAADGVAPTLAQALMAIQQRLYDADVSGTTLTVRQLDGTTAAITITLDDGTNPTDVNRTA